MQKTKPTFLPWFINVTVYIWLQLCQILTDFNNFCTAETGKQCAKESMYLFIYYLKKVLLWRNNLSLFAYDENTLKTQNVNKRKQGIDKKCLGIKRVKGDTINWGISKKKWSKRGVEDFLKRLRTAGSIERAPGSGRCAPRHRRGASSVIIIIIIIHEFHRDASLETKLQGR